MKKRFMVLMALVCLVFAGCAGGPAQIALTTSEAFDKEAAQKQMRLGNNTINGSALLQQLNGGVITCAGNQVRLIPSSNYARERMAALYLDENGGLNQFIVINPFEYPPKFDVIRTISTPPEPEYFEIKKETVCNTQGFFSFSGLADGDYYIITYVRWQIPQYPWIQGGQIMKKVHVEGGEVKEVVITGQP